QNMRHQGSQPKHHLGSSRGRRRAKLSEYVNGFFTHIRSATAVLAPVPNPNLLKVFEPEFPRKSAAVRRTLNRISPKLSSDRPRRHDAALIPAFKDGGHARSGQLLRAGPKQSILPNAAAPRAFVRQMESTSRDPFAFFTACGCGRTGCTRHILASDALRPGAATARGLFPHLSCGQLSRRSPRRRSARRRGGGVLLPCRASWRSPQQRAPRPYLPGGTRQRRS